MHEFKVNEYIRLKLEEVETNIYVNGELFNQYKHILTRKKDRLLILRNHDIVERIYKLIKWEQDSV